MLSVILDSGSLDPMSFSVNLKLCRANFLSKGVGVVLLSPSLEFACKILNWEYTMAVQTDIKSDNFKIFTFSNQNSLIYLNLSELLLFCYVHSS